MKNFSHCSFSSKTLVVSSDTLSPQQDNPDRLGEKARLIIDAALDAVVGLNKDGSITIWNPQAEVIFGWKKEEVIGESMSDKIIPSQYRAQHSAGFQRYLQTGEHTVLNTKIEITAIDRNGREFPIELSIVAIGEGEEEFFCAFIRDISHRKETYQTLIKQKEFSESVINSLPGIFYLFDQSGKNLLWNRNLEIVTGYSGEEIAAINPLAFFEGEDKELVHQRIQQVFSNGKADVEAHLKTKRGESIPYYLTGKLINVEGKCCLMGMGIDISNRVFLQRDLDAKTKQLQQEMTTAVIKAQESERSQIGQELHDNVNQVLTTVKLYNEMLRDGLGSSKDISSKSMHLLQNCIDEIRSLSKRLSAPTLGNITLQESIKELIESINLTKRVNIIYSLEGYMNREITQEIHLAIYRIVQEQLNNILKYAGASYVTITIKREEGILRLTILDDGHGFDLQTKKSGIGITNMKTRAESLQGSFCLQTAPGKGCRIQVAIPLTSNRADRVLF